LSQGLSQGAAAGGPQLLTTGAAAGGGRGAHLAPLHAGVAVGQPEHAEPGVCARAAGEQPAGRPGDARLPRHRARGQLGISQCGR